MVDFAKVDQGGGGGGGGGGKQGQVKGKEKKQRWINF